MPRPHEQRVIDERDELVERIQSLFRFMHSPEWDAISESERRLLNKQHKAMCEYREILGYRIDAFLPDRLSVECHIVTGDTLEVSLNLEEADTLSVTNKTDDDWIEIVLTKDDARKVGQFMIDFANS